MRYIIAIIVIWIGITIIYTSGISYYIGALPAALLVGCLFGWGYIYAFKGASESETFSKITDIIQSFIGYIIAGGGILLFLYFYFDVLGN